MRGPVLALLIYYIFRMLWRAAKYFLMQSFFCLKFWASASIFMGLEPSPAHLVIFVTFSACWLTTPTAATLCSVRALITSQLQSGQSLEGREKSTWQWKILLSVQKYIPLIPIHDKSLFYLFDSLTSGEEPTFVPNSKLAKVHTISPNNEEDPFKTVRSIVVV